ncbi:MAG: hypothetical protein FJ008_00185 [Chloroflexi bacterium]|nr:hypothetical protein [Chloroflexota bacterium]MBM3173982.1 hypothetical protein [Chloroflexota bacterium]MBM3174128.1 hypothetical protein [Chloroflexota bacterium]MBM4449196.1 hypothetical protein [Chloroflexota bacterium]
MSSNYKYDQTSRERIEKHFLESLHWHISGWREKVEHDFGKESFARELEALHGDSVYRQFAFACPEYVLVRLMGRMSISIGRRLGEMYDKLPRFVASARFGLSLSEVVEKVNGLEADLVLRKSKPSQQDQAHLDTLIARWFKGETVVNGIAIEIRYNFNPNDSARLRKDVQLASLVKDEGLFPAYLIYSGISPRHEAIARLTRAGWNFLAGIKATDFTTELLGMDVMEILERPTIRQELENEVMAIMKSIFTSYAFMQACNACIKRGD